MSGFDFGSLNLSSVEVSSGSSVLPQVSMW